MLRNLVGIFIHRAKIFRPQFFGENLIWYFSGIIFFAKTNIVFHLSLLEFYEEDIIVFVNETNVFKNYCRVLHVKNVLISPRLRKKRVLFTSLPKKKLFTHLSSIAESTDEVDQNLLVIDELSDKNDTL